jgi:L-fuconolactonase
MHRREFLQASALLGIAGISRGDERPMPIVDSHTHFYDPTRPQGVPWPGKDNKTLYRRVLPDEFRKLVRPHGVTGTIVVEASPWLEDNQWLLDLAGKEPFIVGVVGNLDPLHAEFPKHLARFARDRRFRGIRIGHTVLQKSFGDRRFQTAMGLLVESDLELDVNGGPEMHADVARLARQFSDLRIVINHAANLRIDGKAPPDAWLKGMRDAARSRNVFCKVSALAEGTGRNDRTAPREVAFYRPVLDALWDIFGENRLIYGSNWPVSERFGDYATVFGVVQEYFQGKGRRAQERFFAGNAQDAYKGVLR